MLPGLYKLSLSSTLSLLCQRFRKFCCRYLQGTCGVICTIQEPGTQQVASNTVSKCIQTVPDSLLGQDNEYVEALFRSPSSQTLG